MAVAAGGRWVMKLSTWEFEVADQMGDFDDILECGVPEIVALRL